MFEVKLHGEKFKEPYNERDEPNYQAILPVCL